MTRVLKKKKSKAKCNYSRLPVRDRKNTVMRVINDAD